MNVKKTSSVEKLARHYAFLFRPSYRVLMASSLIAMLVVSARPHSTAGQGVDSLPSIATISEHWRMHAAKIRSARFVWTKRQEVPRELLALMAPVPTKTQGATDGIHVSETTCHFTCEDEKMRLEIRGQAPSSSAELTVMDQVITFDGANSTDYQPALRENKLAHGQAVIEKQNRVALDPAVMPLLWSLRPNPLINKIQKWEVTWTKGEDGRRLVAISQPPGSGSASQRQSFWVDPAKDYALVRSVKTDRRTNKLNQQVDLFLVHDKEAGWLPGSWTYIEPINDRHTAVVLSKVTDYSVNVSPTTDESFQVELPPGTLVIDRQGNVLKTSSGRTGGIWLILAVVFLTVFVSLWLRRRWAKS